MEKSRKKITWLLAMVLIVLAVSFIILLVLDWSDGNHYQDSREYVSSYDWNKVEPIDESHDYLFDILSSTPLPDEVQIDYFEYHPCAFVEKILVQVYLVLPSDSSLVRDTLEILSQPVENSEYFYIYEQDEEVIEENRSSVTILAYREVSDEKEQICGGTLPTEDEIEQVRNRSWWRGFLEFILLAGIIIVIVFLAVANKKAPTPK